MEKMSSNQQIKQLLRKLLSLNTSKLEEIQKICHKHEIQIPEIAIKNNPTYHEIYLKTLQKSLQAHLMHEYKINTIKSTNDAFLDILILLSLIVILSDTIIDHVTFEENEIISKFILDFVFIDEKKEDDNYFRKKISDLEIVIKRLEIENKDLKECLEKVCNLDISKNIDIKEVDRKEYEIIKNRFEIEHKIIKKAWYRLAKQIMGRKK